MTEGLNTAETMSMLMREAKGEETPALTLEEKRILTPDEQDHLLKIRSDTIHLRRVKAEIEKHPVRFLLLGRPKLKIAYSTTD